jgi:hypothetical protein
MPSPPAWPRSPCCSPVRWPCSPCSRWPGRGVGGRRGDDVISRALALPLTVTVAALWGCGAGTPAVPANASPGQKLFTQTGCGSCQVAAFVARASEGTP